MTTVLRLSGAAVGAVLAIRILDALLTPALPLLVTLFVMVLVARLVWGRRDL